MFLLWSLVSPLRYPHQWPRPLITPAAQNGIHIICIPHTNSPHGPKRTRSMTSIRAMPRRLCGVYSVRSIQSSGVPTPYCWTIARSLLAKWYRPAPLNNTRQNPYTCGLCGSPSCYVNLWCLRWTATHCLVTIPVVSHNQKRIKCSRIGWNLIPLWAWPLCKNNVTEIIVMCVTIKVYKMMFI